MALKEATVGRIDEAQLLSVLTSFKKGDFSARLPLNWTGVAGKVADTLNEVIELNEKMAKEFERIRRVVGREGKLTQRASLANGSGGWLSGVDSVNSLIEDLVHPTTEVARVIGAVAKGDLSQTMPLEIEGRPVKGEFLRMAKTINTMVEQLGSFASEVTRVAREVGTEGKLGGQAEVRGVSGTWKELTENVNLMAGNLTAQVRNIAEVTTAVAQGDLSKKITVDVKGEILELKETINRMVDQLSSFASEVTRVAREVGTEGKLGGQARVKGVAGTWKELTDNVNLMANNLTSQVRNIAEVTTAVARGDLSKKITVDVRGEILELKNTINVMVDQLNTFASEVTRVAREVGTEGKLGGQAVVEGVGGTWKGLTDNVNFMASNLTEQVRNIAEVATAVANGDLSRKITIEARGEILELKNTLNTMVDQLNTFAAEVTRVAREVGTEGKLGGQAVVEGVGGTWKGLTDNVNLMASNLTEQVRNIADVATAVANGDLSRKITIEARGEILELKSTLNVMVDQLNTFAAEVTRVAREVGTEGKLGGQAVVEGVGGTWKGLTDNVNFMASNLTEQVRNIADVATAVANGDLSRKITIEARGEILELKNTLNVMVDQLNTFAAEVTRLAREVGTEGQLGGQAVVEGVGGTWKGLTDNVNLMASNLTGQVRNIAEVAKAVANGDLSKKITIDVKGEILDLKNTLNTMVDQLNTFAAEVTRVAREVGTEGKLGGQAEVKGVSGTWKDLTDNVNLMASNLTGQVRNIAEVAKAVARGDLSKKITVDVKGEILELKATLNTMVDQLNTFASEVTRVAREVGTEGILGGQAEVKGVSGTWKELSENVNTMAANLTTQVRGIAKVVTAVANGNLKQKLLIKAKGEIATLAETINEMIDTLAVFANQVTSVAHEVGIEGKLGGQAEVPGAAGTWRDLTDNVNELAANLTRQMRAIGEVATAVTKGDLTRSITVEARGEVEALKDNINAMIATLRETTRVNTEQDWLKTNLAKFTGMLQGERELVNVSKLILSQLAPLVSAQHGVFFIVETGGDDANLRMLASYAYKERKSLANRFRVGEGLVGQCALEGQRILLTDVPGDYVRITSGLGEAPPMNIVVLPVLFEGAVKAVIELASFRSFSEIHLTFLEQLTESIGIVLNTISATMRTEELLKESQALTTELQSRQEELRKTNEELEEKARQLSEQNAEVERKNREVEFARRALEDKAEQLALTSKYKSEFLANMSHELRTPLNSLLILAKLLAQNTDSNLSEKQVEFAETIHSAGSELLSLINDILDLSKIESGTMAIEIEGVGFGELGSWAERSFQQVAGERHLEFRIDIDPALPPTIHTDPKRLQQVLKNLLSNAFKFTERGNVTLHMASAVSGWSPDHDVLNRSEMVIGFSVVDTGIGIPKDKQRIIFEAFQQADGTTSRKYGGTGLGLSISREIARLLGGQITVASTPGKGSTFTLYLPVTEVSMPASTRRRTPETLERPSSPLSVPAILVVSEESTDSETIPTSGPPPAQLLSQARPAMTAPADGGARSSPPAEGPGITPVGRARSKGPAETTPVQAKTRAKAATVESDIAMTDELSIPQPVLDDRDEITADSRLLLIIEDDARFARILLDVAHEKEFQGIVALTGESGLALAKKYKPHAIILDVRLPGMNGWTVLDRLKRDAATRHIPVNVVSVTEERQRSMRIGAIAHLHKPTTKEALDGAFDNISRFLDHRAKRLLVVEDNPQDRDMIVELIGGDDDVQISTTETAAGALDALGRERFDCLVLDLGLPDMDGFELLDRIQTSVNYELPVVIYTGREFTPAEQSRIRGLSERMTVKDAHSPERLLEETVLFLHRIESSLSEPKRQILQRVHDADPTLTGKRVLIIDDDVRNIFAITALLERQQIRVEHAENGRDGMEVLKSTPDIDLVLMDIMMPEMDGYEAIRQIRLIPKFASLPIIALTAKAMKSDREHCIEAGASDYISKPVDSEQLMSLLRVWLHQ